MENIFIQNRKGLRMALRISIEPENKKLVFLMHGLGARKEYPHMLVLEEEFLKKGYNVINIDTTNSNNASDVSDKGPTLTGMYEDLEDTINWAKTQNFYTHPFALAGQSLGAQTIILYASKNPQMTNLVVSCAMPWLNGKIEVKQNKRTSTILKEGFFTQTSKTTGKTLKITKSYLDDFEKYDFAPLVQNITADTHIIVGTKDTEYHIENNKKLYELLTCKKSLQILENVPHDLANTPETKTIFQNAVNKILNQYK